MMNDTAQLPPYNFKYPIPKIIDIDQDIVTMTPNFGTAAKFLKYDN